MPLFFIFVFSVKILPMTGVESRNIMAHKVTSLEFDFSNDYILASIRCTDFLDPNDDTIYQIETRIVMFNFTHCLFKFQLLQWNTQKCWRIHQGHGPGLPARAFPWLHHVRRKCCLQTGVLQGRFWQSAHGFQHNRVTLCPGWDCCRGNPAWCLRRQELSWSLHPSRSSRYFWLCRLPILEKRYKSNLLGAYSQNFLSFFCHNLKIWYSQNFLRQNFLNFCLNKI